MSKIKYDTDPVSLQRIETSILQAAYALDFHGYEHIASHLYSIADDIISEKEVILSCGPIIEFKNKGKNYA